MSRLKIIMLAVAVFLVYRLVVVSPGYADSQGEIAHGEIAASTRILVLPFQNMTRIHGNKHTMRGPLTRKVFVTSAVAAKAELILDAVLMDLLSLQSGMQVQVPQVGDGGQFPDDAQGVELIKALQLMGQRNRADAIMVGYLYGYRDRVGGAFGAHTSAMVAFELVLVGVKNGGIMWRSGVSETQQPLNENLLDIGKFIRRKGRWVTAREMSEQAMQEMLQSFPVLQSKPKNKEAGTD